MDNAAVGQAGEKDVRAGVGALVIYYHPAPSSLRCSRSSCSARCWALRSPMRWTRCFLPSLMRAGWTRSHICGRYGWPWASRRIWPSILPKERGGCGASCAYTRGTATRSSACASCAAPWTMAKRSAYTGVSICAVRCTSSWKTGTCICSAPPGAWKRRGNTWKNGWLRRKGYLYRDTLCAVDYAEGRVRRG